MEHKIEKILKEKVKPYKKCNFLITVSGGVDSMVLANLFLKNNLSFSIAHCNFKLRLKESNIDHDFVKKLYEEFLWGLLILFLIQLLKMF